MDKTELSDKLLDLAGGDPFVEVVALSASHQTEHGCGLHTAGGPVMATVGSITRASGAHRILDLGSGLGYSTLWLAHSGGPSAHVTGIDADPKHTVLATEIAGRFGYSDRTNYLTGVVDEVLPTLTGTFDLIHDDAWFADQPNHLDQVVDLLRPGGTLTMANWFLLIDSMDDTASNDWEMYAGPDWQARTQTYAEHLASRDDLHLHWIVDPPVGVATKADATMIGLDSPMAAGTFRRTPEQVADPVLSWQRPDRAFFAAGACHILAQRLAERLPDFGVVHIHPLNGKPGSHVYATHGDRAFDFNGWSSEADLLEVNIQNCQAADPGWDHDLIVVDGDLNAYWRSVNHRTAEQYPGEVDSRADQYIDYLLRSDTAAPEARVDQSWGWNPAKPVVSIFNWPARPALR